MKNYMKVAFLAKTENVIFCRTVAIGFLINLNLEVGVLNEIKTAISEAVTNAIVHGYKSDESKLVEFVMSYDDSQITMEVIDYGIGIEDIEQARVPLYSSKISEERAGLGFTIMEVFSDELMVESVLGEKTIVTMVKRYNDSGQH
jgi:stage II sporulation protein AB (anti-sigma F factor)